MTKIKREYYLVLKKNGYEPISSRIVTKNAGMFSKSLKDVKKTICSDEKLVRTTLKEYKAYELESFNRMTFPHMLEVNQAKY